MAAIISRRARPDRGGSGVQGQRRAGPGFRWSRLAALPAQLPVLLGQVDSAPAAGIAGHLDDALGTR